MRFSKGARLSADGFGLFQPLIEFAWLRQFLMVETETTCATMYTQHQLRAARSHPPGLFFAHPQLQGEAQTMASSFPDQPGDSPAQSLAVVLCTTLSLLDSYAPHIRDSSSLRDLERALICAISDLKRGNAREHEHKVHETLHN
jgi:hypothetical protein